MIEFINLNLDSKRKITEFLKKYLLGYYLLDVPLLAENIRRSKVFSKDELECYSSDIYDDLYDEIKSIQEDFISSINHIFGGVERLILKGHKEGDKDVDFSQCYLMEMYATLFGYEGNVLVDFELSEFCYLQEDDDEIADVEMGFSSDFIGNILYICLRKLIFIKNILILKCENCHEFFIPDSLHYPKYCNKVHKNGKTCKEIGANLAYKERLNSDEALKKYRSRYSSLSSNASNYPDNVIAMERFENYKRVGAEKKRLYLQDKITKDEFLKWIDSTKIRE